LTKLSQSLGKEGIMDNSKTVWVSSNKGHTEVEYLTHEEVDVRIWDWG
jgi:hypothetical protein